MSGHLHTVRVVFALLLLLLGLVVLGRGLAAGAPPSFIAMGAGMAVLGLYRLRFRLRSARGR